MFPQGLQSLVCFPLHQLFFGIKKIRKGSFGGASYSSPKLIGLREAKTLRIADDQGINIWHVDPRFDNGRTYEHIDLSAQKPQHYLLQLLAVHSSMGDLES